MTPKQRKEIEGIILQYVGKIDPSGLNTKMYQEIFKTLSDADLVKHIEKRIMIYAPNNSPVDIDSSRNIRIGKELGYDFYQQLWLTDPKTGACSLTKYEHILLELPVRRQSQMIDKKISIAEHNRTIDKLTGQPTGDSKGSSFSFPQTYVMFAKGYDATLKELMRTRGGDTKAAQVVDRQIRQTGHSSQEFEGSANTRVKSTKTTGAVFTAMHLGNSLK